MKENQKVKLGSLLKNLWVLVQFLKKLISEEREVGDVQTLALFFKMKSYKM
jgi:hypothetical protein